MSRGVGGSALRGDSVENGDACMLCYKPSMKGNHVDTCRLL